MNYQDNGEVNQLVLAINFKITQQERLIGAAFVNLNERSIQITEFTDNDHFTSLESLILQFNNSNQDAKFRILMNSPPDIYKPKVEELIKSMEVELV